MCGGTDRAVTQELPTATAVLMPAQLVMGEEVGIGAPENRALCSTHQPGATLF